MSTADKIRYAVVGVGSIAQEAVLPAFQHAENPRLGAPGDEEKRQKLGETYNCRAYPYDRYEETVRFPSAERQETCIPASKEHFMQNKIKQTDPDKKLRRVLSASTIEGDSVRNQAGESLGKVDEIMVDIPSGRVAYVVLSFGGVLGLGNKLFAIPWNAVTVDEDEKCLILNIDKGTLENAPGFDKDSWPDMGDTSWGSQIHRYYGASPYWEEQYPREKTFRGGGGGM